MECPECAEFKEKRKKATLQSEREKVQAQYEAHLRLIFADRNTDEKQNMVARMSCRPNSVMQHRLLKLDLDGMDQAKFRIPRNISASKALSDLWRPQLHVVGVIIQAVAEIYFLCDSDLKKDSNTQRTILIRALQIASGILKKRGMSLPMDWLFHAPRSDLLIVLYRFGGDVHKCNPRNPRNPRHKVHICTYMYVPSVCLSMFVELMFPGGANGFLQSPLFVSSMPPKTMFVSSMPNDFHRSTSIPSIIMKITHWSTYFRWEVGPKLLVVSTCTEH